MIKRFIYIYNGFLEFDVVADITPITPARMTADPYWSTPAEGGDVDILSVKLKNTERQLLEDDDFVQEIIDYVKNGFAEDDQDE